MISPLVSIIIPTYNRAHLIGETLDSILKQTYENWECIIVDDGSTDTTDVVVGKYLKKDPRFQYHLRPTNRPKGANACRNYGFELSKGEYVNWFDSDDLAEINFITERIQFFDDYTHFVIGSGSYWNPDNDERNFIDLNLRTNLFKDYSLWKLQILTPSVMFRKSFLNDTELFKTKIKRGQEAELFSRLFYRIKASDYVLVNKPLFLYRKHQESKSFKSSRYVESYKESQTYIALENFKRSAELIDLELLMFFNNILIVNFFTGIQKRHISNSRYILRNYTPMLFKVNSRFAIVFYMVGYFFLLIRRGSYKVEKRLRNYKML